MDKPAAEIWDCTDEEYFADTERVSRSMLDAARSSMALYHALHVERSITPPPSTPARQRGTLTHLSLFQPEVYARTVVTAPVADLRTKDGKATWADWLSTLGLPERTKRGELAAVLQTAGLVLATAEDRVAAEAISGAIRRHSKASKLIEAAEYVEKAVVWQDPITGLMCKAKPDAIVILPNGLVVIVDLKTTIAPDPYRFAKSVTNYGYHRQAAFYRRGVHALCGGAEPPRFVFVAVRNEPPWEVATYELDYEALQLGESQIAGELMRVKLAHDTGVWVEPWQQRTITLELPPYAGAESQWEVR